jgi:hypothetical protein
MGKIEFQAFCIRPRQEEIKRDLIVILREEVPLGMNISVEKISPAERMSGGAGYPQFEEITNALMLLAFRLRILFARPFQPEMPGLHQPREG